MSQPPRTPAAFDPVPRRARHDGWTPTRQRDFIAALAETGCVSRAAARVGKTPESAYQLRRAPDAESFAAAWGAALRVGVDRLTDIAFERAIDGVPVPVFHKGEQVGERRAYNDRLLMFTLRHHDPGRYGDGSTRANALSPASQARLKREWAAERAAVTAEVRERRALKMIRDDLVVSVSLSDRFTRMNERMTGERAPTGPDGEYLCGFRSELAAFDLLHPDVRDWTDADVEADQGWPAGPHAGRDWSLPDPVPPEDAA